MEKMEKKTKTKSKPKLRRKRHSQSKPRRDNTIQQVYIYSGSERKKDDESFMPRYSVFGNPYPTILTPQFHTPNIGAQLISALKSVNYNNLSTAKLETPNILNETKTSTIQPKELNNEPKEPIISNQEKNDEFTEQSLEGESTNRNFPTFEVAQEEKFITPVITPVKRAYSKRKKMDDLKLKYDATQSREEKLNNYNKLLELKEKYEQEIFQAPRGQRKSTTLKKKSQLDDIYKMIETYQDDIFPLKPPKTI